MKWLSLSYERIRARLAGGICPDYGEVIALSCINCASEQAWWCCNTNRLHTHYGRRNTRVRAAADHIYLSQDLGMRKPETRIYQHVLQKGFRCRCGLFDDNADNIEGDPAS